VLSILPSYYLTNQWLENFAYSTQFKWYDFVLGPSIALIFAILTMSILVIRASSINPVKSLRSE
jgi:putative ABC transport system permease protein